MVYKLFVTRWLIGSRNHDLVSLFHGAWDNPILTFLVTLKLQRYMPYATSRVLVHMFDNYDQNIVFQLLFSCPTVFILWLQSNFWWFNSGFWFIAVLVCLQTVIKGVFANGFQVFCMFHLIFCNNLIPVWKLFVMWIHSVIALQVVETVTWYYCDLLLVTSHFSNNLVLANHEWAVQFWQTYCDQFCWKANH